MKAKRHLKYLLTKLLALVLVATGCAGQIAAENLEKQRPNVERLLDIAAVTTDVNTLRKITHAFGRNFYTLDNVLNDQPPPDQKPPVGGWLVGE